MVETLLFFNESNASYYITTSIETNPIILQPLRNENLIYYQGKNFTTINVKNDYNLLFFDNLKDITSTKNEEYISFFFEELEGEKEWISGRVLDQCISYEFEVFLEIKIKNNGKIFTKKILMLTPYYFSTGESGHTFYYELEFHEGEYPEKKYIDAYVSCKNDLIFSFLYSESPSWQKEKEIDSFSFFQKSSSERVITKEIPIKNKEKYLSFIEEAFFSLEKLSIDHLRLILDRGQELFFSGDYVNENTEISINIIGEKIIIAFANVEEIISLFFSAIDVRDNSVAFFRDVFRPKQYASRDSIWEKPYLYKIVSEMDKRKIETIRSSIKKEKSLLSLILRVVATKFR